ncbi:MAG: hypothetical protein ACPIOQ_31600, partial [Promethearchaeia archaeon]
CATSVREWWEGGRRGRRDTDSPGNSGPGGMEEAPTQTDVIDAEASSRTAAIVGAVLLLSVSRTVAGGLAAWCTC